jgi:hypothetical protein
MSQSISHVCDEGNVSLQAAMVAKISNQQLRLWQQESLNPMKKIGRTR